MFDFSLRKFQPLLEFHENQAFYSGSYHLRVQTLNRVLIVICLEIFLSIVAEFILNMENIFRRILCAFKFPIVKADEEVVDPHPILKEECGQKHCAALQEKYDMCNQRVNSKQNTAETCEEELFDFLECVDHCVAKTLFKKLK